MENLRGGCTSKNLPWNNMYAFDNIYPDRFKYEMALIVFFNFVLNFCFEYFLQNQGRRLYRAKTPLASGMQAVESWSQLAKSSSFSVASATPAVPVEVPVATK